MMPAPETIAALEDFRRARRQALMQEVLARLTRQSNELLSYEDVRRAQPGWAPRTLDAELVDDLAGGLKRAKLLARKAPCGIELAPDDGHAAVTAKAGEPSVTVRGSVGELVLWMFGRQAHAVVDYEGPDDAVTLAQTAKLGI